MPHVPGPTITVRSKASPAAGQLSPLDENLQLVSAKPGEVVWWEIVNPNAVDKAWLKVFNANKTTDVTLGTTEPKGDYELNPGINYPPAGFIPEHCSQGIVIAVCLDRKLNSSAPSTDCEGDLKYTKLGGGLF